MRGVGNNETRHTIVSGLETCALERDVPQEQVIDMRETLGDDGSEDFEIIEDLTTTALFSSIEEKQRLAHQALCGLLGTPVEIHVMKGEDLLYAYLTFNGIEDGFFFVGAFPTPEPGLEALFTEHEAAALRKMAGSYYNQ